MSDLGLRELERRFRASGSVEDEAAWLRGRVQAGELEHGKLELAAGVGWPAASLATGVQPAGGWEGVSAVLPPDDTSLHVRCALAPGRVVRPADERHSDLIACGLARLEEWVTLRDESAAHRLSQAAEDLYHAFIYGPSAAPAESPERADLVEDRSSAIAEAIVFSRHILDEEAEEPRAEIPTEFWLLRSALEFWVRALGEEATVEAIRDDVAPWLLGYADPVRERVEVRQQEPPRE